MKRRTFMTLFGGAAILAPAAVLAQQPRPRRVAFLGLGRPDPNSPYVESLRTGLRELGWVEGRNLTLSVYWATGRDDMEASGRELLASDPEVIVTQELMVYSL
jgi:putative tryptophan/tyrosine transport system substrate-binding protein